MQVHAIHQNHIYLLLLGAAFLLMSFVPATAQAASRPTCSVTITTEEGKKTTFSNKDVEAAFEEGDEITLSWKSRNAKEATLNGDEIEVSGEDEVMIDETGEFAFVFENGNRRATCTLTALVINAEADDVTTTNRKPTLTGEAEGLKRVRVAVYNDDGRRVFEKKNVPVKRDGSWKVRVNKSLKDGEYEIRLMTTTKKNPALLDTATLTIGEEDNDEDEDRDSSDSILAVSVVPLLFGGTTAPGSSPSIMAIQLRNAGDENVDLDGFSLKQRGTASTDVITQLSISDEKGGSRNASSGNFRDGVGFIGTDVTLAPGELKIFTIKATLSSSARAGTTLLFDVSSIKTNGSAKGRLPLRGPTWTIR